MPKIKTRKGAVKRFKLTANGKVKRNQANAGHIMTKKSPKRERNLRGATLVNKADVPRIKRMLG